MNPKLEPTDQWNIGHICTTLQCAEGRGDKTAFRWLAPTMEKREFSFAELDRESGRFANSLHRLGFRPGDTFFIFLPKLPEQFFSFLGSLKMRLITGTLFSNFGEEALLDRLGDAGAKGIITKKSLLRRVSRIRSAL